jgi:hypothetical protein
MRKVFVTGMLGFLALTVADTRAQVAPGLGGLDRMGRKPEAKAVTDKTAQRAKGLKVNIDDFELDLRYYGESGKPYYRVTLAGPAAYRRQGNALRKRRPFHKIVPVGKTLAGKIVDHLAADGFLKNAGQWDSRARVLRAAPKGPVYRMTVRGMGHWVLYEDLPWDATMVRRLTALRGAVPKPMPPAGWHGLCSKCSRLMFTADVGRCSSCDGHTSSGSHKYCLACAAKLGRCRACAKRIRKPARVKGRPGDKAVLQALDLLINRVKPGLAKH